jgi:hypothetical protein
VFSHRISVRKDLTVRSGLTGLIARDGSSQGPRRRSCAARYLLRVRLTGRALCLNVCASDHAFIPDNVRRKRRSTARRAAHHCAPLACW